MEQLTSVEASFLEAEDADRHLSLAIGTLAVIDGPMPERQRLMAIVSERARDVPRLMQLVRKHPLELAAPEWVDDDEFDIAHHLRWTALPHPGDDAALFRLIADLMERRLDRDRPLWEYWVIEGLPDGRWATLVKVHHCLTDGIAAVQLLAGFADAGPGAAFAADIGTPTQPRPSSIVSSAGLSRNPLTWPGGLWRASVAGTSTAAQTALGAAEFVTGMLRPAGTSPRGPVATMRRYSAARVSLKDVESVCRAFDVTLNDVALAAITDSFRTVLQHRGEKPRRNSLRTIIPVSAASSNAADGDGVGATTMLASLPIEEHDPIKRLKSVHARLDALKESGERQAANTFVTLADNLPFALGAWTVRLLTRLPQRGVVTLATNVAGPRQRLQVLGRPVEALLPIPPIAPQLRTAIGMLSYVDQLVFGIIADYDATPDVDELANGIELGVARLVTRALSRKPADVKKSHRPFRLAN